MSNPIAFHEQARFATRDSAWKLISKLKPFIEGAAERVARTRDLEQGILTVAEKYPRAADHFVILPGRLEETFSLKDRYLYANVETLALNIHHEGESYEIDLAESFEELPELHKVLALCGSGRRNEAEIRGQLNEEGINLLDSMLEIGAVGEREIVTPRFAPEGTPGVFRLQHASLLYRSRQSGILVDPHLHSGFNPGTGSDIYRRELEGKVDAILISHYHNDHFFPATLLMFPPDIPIVVPKVPRSTIICGDMQAQLCAFGFRNVIAAEWFSRLQFGDMEVHVLPFYGEQPLRFEESKDPTIRNWGNTYVVQSDDYTSWFLIDSGSDARGAMTELAVHVWKKFGQVDFVLSNLRRFMIHTPKYINGGLNWLTLSPKQVRDFVAMAGHCITLAPPGVAQICKTVKARYYLPYAHWWGEVGSVADSGADTPGQGEKDLIQELNENLHRVGGSTEIIPWHIGDGFVRGTRGFRRLRIGAL